MSEELRKASWVRGPRTGLTFARATSTTPISIDLTSYVGRYVSIVAQTADTFILFGSSQANAELVDNTAVSGNGQASMIAAGAQADFVVDSAYPWIGAETASGTGTIRVHVSSDQR